MACLRTLTGLAAYAGTGSTAWGLADIALLAGHEHAPVFVSVVPSTILALAVVSGALTGALLLTGLTTRELWWVLIVLPASIGAGAGCWVLWAYVGSITDSTVFLAEREPSVQAVQISGLLIVPALLLLRLVVVLLVLPIYWLHGFRFADRVWWLVRFPDGRAAVSSRSA